MNFLEKLKKLREDEETYGESAFFDEHNLVALFGLMDVTGQGFITKSQYTQGEFLPRVVEEFQFIEFRQLSRLWE